MGKAMVKIPIYSEEAFTTFLANIKENVDNYRESKTGWIEEYLADKGYKPSGYEEFPAVRLTYNPKNRSKSDYDNAIKLYTSLRFIDKFQASNGMYWTFLSLHNLNYLNLRNKIAKDDNKAAEDILRMFCCPWNPSKRELARCTLSSLWRIVDLTVDDSRGDNKRFELTEEAFRNSDMMQSLTDRVPFMNRNVTRGVLQYSLSCRKDNHELDKLDYQQIAVHINSIAGSVRIDMMSETEIYEICETFMDWFVNSGTKEKLQKEKIEQNRNTAMKQTKLTG